MSLFPPKKLGKLIGAGLKNLSQSPNIIILILDAVRAKSLSAYHDKGNCTEFLDEFAAENILFKRAYTTSTWTIPTHASMLTGLYLSQHRVENLLSNRSFNKEIVPLPVALRDQGYQTAAFSQSVLFSPRYFLDPLFDDFYISASINNRQKNGVNQKTPSNALRKLIIKVERYFSKAMRLKPFLGDMFDWVNIREKPFFLISNISAAHYPWAPSPGFLLKRVGVRRLRQVFQEENHTLKPFDYNSGKLETTQVQREMWKLLYAAAVSHLDSEVGRFIRKLKRWKGWQNTIVIITADHGEMLGEHQGIVGHTLTLHDNLLHVPLIVHHPDYPDGQEVEGVVQNLDIFPSVMEWSNSVTTNLPDAQLQRPSLSTAVADPASPAGFAFAEEDYTDSYDVLRGLHRNNPSFEMFRFPRQQIAARSANWKYIWRDDGIGEFYDTLSDPEEKNNLVLTGDDRERHFLRMHQTALEDWRSNLTLFPPHIWNESKDAISEEVQSRLRELGYLE